MWERLRRFSALPPSAKAVFLRAALLLPLTSMSLRLRGFRRTQRWLQTPLTQANASPRLPDLPPETEAYVAMIARMVLAAARHSLVPTTCLERSLVLWRLLAQRGMPSQLRIGVRKSGDEFEAHAWVERNGVAVAEPESNHLHYAAFAKEFNGFNGEPS